MSSRDRRRLDEMVGQTLKELYAKPAPTNESYATMRAAEEYGRLAAREQRAKQTAFHFSDRIKQYVAFAPEASRDALEKEAFLRMVRMVRPHEVFTQLAADIKAQRKAAVDQGFPIPDPLTFDYPAPAGILTDEELVRVKRKRTNG